MTLELDKIRHEIKHILELSGKVRSTELVEKVSKSVNVSHKPVYRELKFLVESEAIKKMEHNRANIEYESVDFKETVDTYSNYFNKKLLEFDKKLSDWHDSFQKKEYLRQMFGLKPLVKALQNIEAEYSILQNFGMFQNSKKLKGIRKLIEKRWANILGMIHITKNKKAVNELLLTLRYEVVNSYRNYYYQKHPATSHTPA